MFEGSYQFRSFFFLCLNFVSIYKLQVISYLIPSNQVLPLGIPGEERIVRLVPPVQFLCASFLLNLPDTLFNVLCGIDKLMKIAYMRHTWFSLEL